MTDRHQQEKPVQQTAECGAFDRQFDAALAKLAAVEPRFGLEDRILANLQAQPARKSLLIWWMWPATTLAVLAIAVGTVLVWKSKTPLHEMKAHDQHVIKQAPNLGAAIPPLGPNTGKTNSPAPLPVRKLKLQVSANAAPKIPKLDQFPSPQPLSDDEKALARYVAQFPQEARLIAQAQAEYAIEVQEKMKRSTEESMDTYQQER